MSLILEALKKSERQRQVGTAPTLATPAMTRRARRSPLPWLIAAIVVAAGAGWWLSRDGGNHSPPELANEPATAPATAAAPPAAEVPMTTVQPPAPVVAPPAAAPTPAAAAPAPIKAEQKSAELEQAVAAAAPPSADNAKKQASGVETAPAPAIATPRTSPTPTGPVAAAPAPAPAPPSQAAPAPAPQTTRSPSAGLPLLWELPYSKRKDIPSLSMSLQVYSDDPASRFAIVNDERRKEGDTIGSGLVLQEITPEGLILEFQGERFLYPRGGR